MMGDAVGGIERAAFAELEPPAPSKPVKHHSSIIRFSAWVLCSLTMVMAGLAYELNKYIPSEKQALLMSLPCSYIATCFPLLLLTQWQKRKWAETLLAGCHLTLLAILPAIFTILDGEIYAGILLIGGGSPVTAAATARHPRTALLFLGLYLAATSAALVYYRINYDITWALAIMIGLMVSVFPIYCTSLVSYLRKEVTVQSEAYKQLVCSVMPAAVAQESFEEHLKTARKTYAIFNFKDNSLTRRLGSLASSIFGCLSSTIKRKSQRQVVDIEVGDSHDQNAAGGEAACSAAWSENGELSKEITSTSRLNKFKGISNAARPHHHPKSAVIFADMVGFSSMCEEVTAIDLLDFMQEVIAVMDAASELYGITKIRTIGDCFFGVSGLMSGYGSPADQEDFCLRAVLFTIDLQNRLSSMTMPNGEPLQLRAGIAYGTLMSGVVGDRRPQFDVYGRLVNLAARLEQSCSYGSTHVSQPVYDDMLESLDHHKLGHIKICATARENVQLKGLGPHNTIEVNVAENSELLAQLDKLQEQVVQPVTARMKQSSIKAQDGWESITGDLKLTKRRVNRRITFRS